MNVLAHMAPRTRVDYAFVTPKDEEWSTSHEHLAFDIITTEIHGASSHHLWRDDGRLFVGLAIDHETPGQVGTALAVTTLLADWDVARLVVLGIAGSLLPEARLGDVVVAPRVIGYVTSWVDRPSKTRTWRQIANVNDRWLVDRVRDLRKNTTEYRKWRAARAARATALGLSSTPEIHIAEVASGNEVVRSSKFCAELRKKIGNNVWAVDMEGHAAFYSAIERADESTCTVGMIRGISDLANEDKTTLEKTSKGAWRTLAIENAASVLKWVLENAPVTKPTEEPRLGNRIERLPFFKQRRIPVVPGQGVQHIALPDLLWMPAGSAETNVSVRMSPTPDRAEVSWQCGFEQSETITTHYRSSIAHGFEFPVPTSERSYSVDLFLVAAPAVRSIDVSWRDVFGRSGHASIDTGR